jgi:hypothetical protein
MYPHKRIEERKSSIFWHITPCISLKFNRRFEGTYRLHLQGRISRTGYQHESKVANKTFTLVFLHCLVFEPEDGGDVFLRNFGSFSTDYTALYPQKMEHFVTIAMRTSNPTWHGTPTFVCQLISLSDLVLFLSFMKCIKRWLYLSMCKPVLSIFHAVKYSDSVGFESLATATMKTGGFGVVTPCNSEICRHFGAIYRFHLHVWGVRYARNQLNLLLASCLTCCSALKTKAMYSSENSGSIRSAMHYNEEDTSFMKTFWISIILSGVRNWKINIICKEFYFML